MATADLTGSFLHGFVEYDPLTGAFFRRKKTNRRVVIGARADFQGPRGYRRIVVDGHRIYAHQAAWIYVYGSPPDAGLQIDHINGDKGDNRISNLRAVTASVNSQNERKSRPNTRSGLLGAHWSSNRNTWRSSIKVGGRVISLGVFKSPEDAHEAYIKAKRKLHEGCTI